MAETDWEAIKKDFESGLSLRVLATKYSISKSMIHKKSTSGQWTQKGGQLSGQWTAHPHPAISTSEAHTIPPTSLAAIAEMMLAQLVEIATINKLDLKEHKMLSDSLGQYSKILAAAAANPTQENQALDASLMAHMTDEEIQVLEEIVARARERKEEAEASNVTPLRKSS